MGRNGHSVRLVFLGTPRAAVPSLAALVAQGHDVRLVVTRPDRPQGRSARPVPSPVGRAAVELGIEVQRPAQVKVREFTEELARHRPELLVVVGYGCLLPASVLSVAPAGAINVHFSMLPAYRGAAPVQWALVNGERRTGVTTMKISERLDEGDILMQQELEIQDGEHAPALADRLADTGAELLVRTVREWVAGNLVGRPQDPARATYAPRLGVADGEVDPVLRAAEIAGRIRGFDPWPGVWLGRGSLRVRLVEGEDTGRVDRTAVPGQVLELEDSALVVACGAGTLLRVTRIQPAGRRVLTARDAVNGRQLRPGDRLVRLGAGR